MTTAQLKSQWTPVNTNNDRYLSIPAARWSESAKQCLALNADCDQCPISKVYGLNWLMPENHTKRCWMPLAVQKLLNRDKLSL